jgi:hypothetical protein
MTVKDRKTQTFVVPEGRCFVTIVDAGVSAFAFQQAAFHKLCKLATTATASGRQAHTWLSNPIVYKAEIENYIDWAAKKPEGTTQLHIAYGDFEEEDLRTTPKFFGQSFLDDTDVFVQNDGSKEYKISICKAGSYFLENAGTGEYRPVEHDSEDGFLTEDEVLSAYDGSVFPTVDEIVGAKVTMQLAEPDKWVKETAFHEEWKDAINYNDDLIIGPNKVLDLLNEKEGRGVFYNLACRVVMDSQVVGARTRSIVGAITKLEDASASAVAPHVATVSGQGTVARRRRAENKATAAAEAAEAAAKVAANAAAMVAETARIKQFYKDQAANLGITLAVYLKWRNINKNDEAAGDKFLEKAIVEAMAKASRIGGTRRMYKGGRRTRKLR